MMWMKVKIFLSKGLAPLLFSFLLMILCLAGCAEDSNILDNGQSRQLKFSVSTHSWDYSDKSSDQKIPSRATPISTFDTSKNFNVIADVNKGGNWSTEINNETVSYSTTNKIWLTSGTHYWPGTGSNVNFYAYYPTSISSDITHATGSAPVFSYTVPDNAADQIDILASSKTGVAGDSYNQTSVDFKHIFAAVQFQVGSSGLPSGTITKVILNNILYKGIYNLDGTWTPNTTDKKSFSQTVSASTNASTTITSGPTTFMMMPQTLSNDASITVTYSNGGTLTKVITSTWEAGKTYTYNLSKTIPVANFDYTGNVQSYTVPLTGIYKLEVWGAQGGEGAEKLSCAKGGYSYGTVLLTKDNILYVCVGAQGGNPTYSSDYSYGVSGIGFGGAGGYNGGGKGSNGLTSYSGSGGGGGATHIATITGLLSSLSSNKSSVLIVAGGGGGGSYGEGGSGGGINGLSSAYGTYTSLGGGQTSGYQFGQGQDGYPKTAYGSCGAEGNGGAGGGWYGGFACQTGNGENTNVGGGGGSGYIGPRVTGATIAGDTSFTDYDGTTVTGHSGNGYARITFVSAN
jgi:hypothetical protein